MLQRVGYHDLISSKATHVVAKLLQPLDLPRAVSQAKSSPRCWYAFEAETGREDLFFSMSLLCKMDENKDSCV